MSIFEFFFGKPKPTSFEASRLPSHNEKFTASDAKKHLREFLKEVQFGDREEIASEVILFGEYLKDYKEYFKDDLDNAKEDLLSEKDALRDLKSELSEFRKEKRNYLLENSVDDFNMELAEHTQYVDDQKLEIEKAKELVELQKMINICLSSSPRRILPIYANQLLVSDTRPLYDLEIPLFSPSVRIRLNYLSSKDEITQRIVDVSGMSAYYFEGHCHLRNEKRKFRYAGVQSYDADDLSENKSLLKYLISFL